MYPNFEIFPGTCMLLTCYRCYALPFFLTWLFTTIVFGNSLTLAQTEDQIPPSVMVCLFVRNKGHLLEDTLTMLENQDYPKSRIGLYVRSDHNEDNTVEILEKWLEKQTEYNFKDVIIDHEKIRQQDQKQGMC